MVLQYSTNFTVTVCRHRPVKSQAVNKHQTTNSDGQGFDRLLGTGPNIIKPLSVLSVLVAVKNAVSLVFALFKLINSLNRNLNEESVTLNKQDNLQT